MRLFEGIRTIAAHKMYIWCVCGIAYSAFLCGEASVRTWHFIYTFVNLVVLFSVLNYLSLVE